MKSSQTSGECWCSLSADYGDFNATNNFSDSYFMCSVSVVPSRILAQVKLSPLCRTGFAAKCRENNKNNNNDDDKTQRHTHTLHTQYLCNLSRINLICHCDNACYIVYNVCLIAKFPLDVSVSLVVFCPCTCTFGIGNIEFTLSYGTGPRWLRLNFIRDKRQVGNKRAHNNSQ